MGNRTLVGLLVAALGIALAVVSAVDAELIRLRKLVDLRESGFLPVERRQVHATPENRARATAILVT
jgi:hypothetical protein